jgi:hypothetical protein
MTVSSNPLPTLLHPSTISSPTHTSNSSSPVQSKEGVEHSQFLLHLPGVRRLTAPVGRGQPGQDSDQGILYVAALTQLGVPADPLQRTSSLLLKEMAGLLVRVLLDPAKALYCAFTAPLLKYSGLSTFTGWLDPQSSSSSLFIISQSVLEALHEEE